MDFLPIKISKSVLDNGLRVITIPMEGRRSATIGVWILTGSANEPKEFLGVSHFIEHIVFKGTKNYSARRIVAEIERKGGSIDAYTAKEETCYHSIMLYDDIDIALKILGEIVCKPAIREEDIELERQVILSEMNEVWDDPGALAQDIFPLLLFGDSPLGRPIFGSFKTVKQITREQMLLFREKHYLAKNIIIGASGMIDNKQFIEEIEKYFNLSSTELPPRKMAFSSDYDGKIIIIPYPAQQVHFFLGTRTFPYSSELRYPLALLDIILGQSSASRLFQKIREEMGLAYVVQSFSEFYQQTGFWAIYAGAAPKHIEKLIVETMKQLKKIANEGISDDELDDAKNYLRGRLLLSAENPWNVLSRAIESEFHLGKFVPFEQTVKKLMMITPEQIKNLAQQLFILENMVAMALGEVDEKMIPDVGLQIETKSIAEIFPDNLGNEIKSNSDYLA